MKTATGALLRGLFDRLEAEYGFQGWWPLATRAGGAGYDDAGYRLSPSVEVNLGSEERLEIAVGAILTQNTAWSNARSALDALHERGLLTLSALGRLAVNDLATIVRSSGYYNQKARKIKELVAYLDGKPEDEAPTRSALLGIWGVGPETADSILLYAYGVPTFVADAYAIRILGRMGLVEGNASYWRVQELVHTSLSPEAERYGELHALLVRHARGYCRSRGPLCDRCPVRQRCARFLESG